MHKIDVYIDLKFEGSFACGKGSYSIVLELLDKKDIPHTKEHFCGYVETTNNRLCIYAVIHALKCITKPCEIEIHINSGYVAGVINEDRITVWKVTDWKSNSKRIKNAELWEQYCKLAADHLIYVTEQKESSYTGAMLAMMKTKNINYITDHREENLYV